MFELIALTLLVVSELSIVEGREDAFLTLVNDGLEISRSFQGNRRFDIYVEAENPGKVLFIEEWEASDDFQRYYQWRLQKGDFAALASYFSAPPRMRKYMASTTEGL